MTNNGGSGKVLFVPRGGGPPSLLVMGGITNPYGIIVAPLGFESEDVKPGDLIVFDNGNGRLAHWGVWSVDRETGNVRRITHGQDLPNGFLSGSFGPDGTLYAGLNDDTRDGSTIVTVSPTGTIDVVLENFAPAGTGHKYELQVATNPVTGEVFFNALGSIYAFHPGEGPPRFIVAGSYGRGHWSDDGTRLYVEREGVVWILEDPTYAPAPHHPAP